MPISGEDVSFGWTFSATLIYVAFPAFLVLYLSVLKYFFGSFSTIRVMNVVKSNSKIRERYLELFTSRDSLMYHVSWSKSRGDFEESNKLMLDLQKLDKVQK
jgi:hypothetical protein